MRTQYDGRGDVCAKSPMGNGENGSFDHILMAQQRLFNLGGRDLLPSAVDDILDSADNEEISLRVQVPKVAGSEPAIPKSGLGSGSIIVVAPRYGGTPQRDLSTFAGRKLSTLAVKDRDLGPRRLANGTNLASAAIWVAASVMP
jgi:hypothetical protein